MDLDTASQSMMTELQSQVPGGKPPDTKHAGTGGGRPTYIVAATFRAADQVASSLGLAAGWVYADTVDVLQGVRDGTVFVDWSARTRPNWPGLHRSLTILAATADVVWL